MAASMASRFCRQTLSNLEIFRWQPGCDAHNVRHYARGVYRALRDVKTSAEDKRQWPENVKIKNPKKNPYVVYEKGDPIHRSMASDVWETSGTSKHIEKPNISKPRQMIKKSKLITKKQSSTDDEVHIFNSLSKSKRRSTSKIVSSYEKIEQGDPRFGQAIIAARSRKEREKKNVIFLEGFRLIQDAIDSGAAAKCIYFSDAEYMERLDLPAEVPLYKVTYKQLKTWADTQTPSGIMALFEKPKQGECPSPNVSAFPLTLICDNVRDPGNMGTLIRTAAAVGCQSVLTTKGCVDVWDPKVIRAGMGSHFHVPTLSSVPWELIHNYVDDSTQVFIAETATNQLRNPREILSEDDIRVECSDLKPISELDAKRQERYDRFTSSDPDLQIDRAYIDSDHVQKFVSAPLQTVSYDEIQCNHDNSQVVLIIGGETTGVGPAAKKFAFDRFGSCVTIPMCESVNSLNSSIAASVILYEIRKHLHNRN